MDIVLQNKVVQVDRVVLNVLNYLWTERMKHIDDDLYVYYHKGYWEYFSILHGKKWS